jgi:hypothetical protein
VYVAYNSFFILGLLCSMQIPFVGFQPVKTSEHMASAGVFALLQVRKKTSVPVKDVPMHESANIVKGN